MLSLAKAIRQQVSLMEQNEEIKLSEEAVKRITQAINLTHH
jgi:hypothetical protein